MQNEMAIPKTILLRVRDELIRIVPPKKYHPALVGAIQIPESIIGVSRFAILEEKYIENYRPIAYRVQFRVPKIAPRAIWFPDTELNRFYINHRDAFLWCGREGFDRWGVRLLEEFDKNFTGFTQTEVYCKSSFGPDWENKGLEIENKISRLVRQLEGKPAMSTEEEKQQKKKRGECTDCPGALMCWGGENLRGQDCVICGRMFVGTMTDDKFESLGELKIACTEVAWRKHVCEGCSPGYKEKVNETLFSLLDQYQTEAT